MEAVIELKEFTLSMYYPDTQYPFGGVWITKKDGEGMAVQLEKFEALIAKYFEENM